MFMNLFGNSLKFTAVRISECLVRVRIGLNTCMRRMVMFMSYCDNFLKATMR